MEHFDVIIVGAGLSGVGAGVHLQKRCPGKTYAILEGREAIGGTWDLFRYPGIRSDSDMYTLGYNFKPWTNAKAIADGPSILDYVRETAREHGVDRHIRFRHKVKRASWDTQAARWTVEAERGDTGETVRLSCNFLFMCSGYYNYEHGYLPEWEGYESYKGRIAHPQFWPEDLDYKGKRVIVIGSGATAMTIVPEMAKDAAHVTMLQRSPTYVVSRPSQDAIANGLRKMLPGALAYGITRWKNVLLQNYFYGLTRKQPEKAKQRLIGMVRRALGPDYDVETHFTPRYNPWDQRLCLIPDDDLYDAIKTGKASVVTDHIERFTQTGITLKSGRTLEADIIVPATGLDLIVLGGVELVVDGARVDMANTLTYKGMMYENVPNLASAFGYTNASWTLKADLTCEYVCRLINYMDAHGYAQATPRNADPAMARAPWLDFSSGYVQRAMAKFPKQGARLPWALHQNYFKDIKLLRRGRVDDPEMAFSRRPPAQTRAPARVEEAA
jgi:cation diffusion facilitator CzcD-associated flavoprotein CzcO